MTELDQLVNKLRKVILAEQPAAPSAKGNLQDLLKKGLATKAEKDAVLNKTLEILKIEKDSKKSELFQWIKKMPSDVVWKDIAFDLNKLLEDYEYDEEDIHDFGVDARDGHPRSQKLKLKRKFEEFDLDEQDITEQLQERVVRMRTEATDDDVVGTVNSDSEIEDSDDDDDDEGESDDEDEQADYRDYIVSKAEEQQRMYEEMREWFPGDEFMVESCDPNDVIKEAICHMEESSDPNAKEGAIHDLEDANDKLDDAICKMETALDEKPAIVRKVIQASHLVEAARGFHKKCPGIVTRDLEVLSMEIDNYICYYENYNEWEEEDDDDYDDDGETPDRYTEYRIKAELKGVRLLSKPVLKKLEKLISGKSKLGKQLLQYMEEFRAIDCIRMEGKKTQPVFDPLAFEAVARETLNDFAIGMGFTPDALKALQVAAEAHLTKVFDKSTKLTIARHSDQLQCEDVWLARRGLE
jgi:histone H3/H4